MLKLTEDFELPSGERGTLKVPRVDRDLERLAMFFAGLPESRRQYLRYNVADIEILRERLAQLDDTNHWRLIAEVNGEIVGDATLDREPYGWTRHVAQIRGVVAPDFDNVDVGLILYKELVHIGDISGIELLYTEVMPKQREAVDILGKAGFERSAILRKFARDVKGRPRDLHVYTNDLRAVWERLAQHLTAMDIKMSW
jgi:hypothetical protein